ncbi:MAG: hypothetical protein C4326_03015 [Ignavibacteria bacterium]
MLAALLLNACLLFEPAADSTFTAGRTEPRTEQLPSEHNNNTTEIHPVRFALVSGFVAASMVGIHIYQQNGWWKNNRSPFHFQEDLKYGRSVDKLGHFYGGTVVAFIVRNAYRWAGLSEETALYWGSAGSLLFQTYVEIEDGFSKWGFDRVDFAADVAGAAWPIAQYHSPFLRNFDFKFSYVPSPALNTSQGVGFAGQKHIMFDDYEGQTIWMSMKMKNLLPRAVASFWPEWLNLSFGYAVRDVFSPNPYSAWLLAFDLDMTKIIPNDTPFLKLLGEALNFIKVPAPTMQFSPRIIWYGIYF